ncbi:MAG: DegQ family serine endoprotease [Gammaproteobacteria bacterium]|nr:DegQ family serine endoprotease [Gammaproteobacteria bacterium]
MSVLKVKQFSVVGFLVLLMSIPMLSNAAVGGLPDFTKLVEQAAPAVVNISTRQKIKRNSERSNSHLIPGLPEGSPFNDFFRRFLDEEGNGNKEESLKEFRPRSLGSGFIFDKAGFVLTNHHVVDGADEVIVRLNDRREFIAEVIGSDKRSDIAVLKINADEDLPVVEIGSPDDLKVGEWVLAIGSPFGFDYTVTAGIVSAKSRSLPSENYVPFIQTDVAINPGNSGGPLFNLKGQVVGVNAQIFSRTGGFMGLSFSIPIDLAVEVSDQLRDTGVVTRGWLGVLIQDVTRDLAESFGMEKPQGALVSRVLPDSPAEAAGFHVGDVIVKFAGRSLPDSSSLPPVVGRVKVGNQVKVNIIREGKPKVLHVRIGELPSEAQAQPASLNKNPQSGTKNVDRIGIVVTNMTSTQRKQAEVGKQGIITSEISRGSAARAGIRKGDIILKIDQIDVKSAKQFRNLVDALPEGKSVPLLVQRNGGPLFLALKVEDR